MDICSLLNRAIKFFTKTTEIPVRTVLPAFHVFVLLYHDGTGNRFLCINKLFFIDADNDDGSNRIKNKKIELV